MHSSNPPLFEGGRGLTLLKTQKRGDGKLLKGSGDPKQGGFFEIRKGGGVCCKYGFFSSWGVTNVTTVTFNYILVSCYSH